jgi:hypothetical protein
VDSVVQWEGGGEFSFLKLMAEPDSEKLGVGRTLTRVWSGMSMADAYT